jgi:hypothetical protein
MNKHRYVRLFLASAFFALMGMVTMGCKQNQGNPTVTEMFTVTFAKPEHGTIMAAIKGGKAIKTGDNVAKGTVIVFTATPDTGFTFEKWTGDLITAGSTASIEHTLMKNITVGALFKTTTPSNSKPGQGGGTTPPSNPDQGGQTSPDQGGGTAPTPTPEYTVTFTKPEYGQLEAIIVGDNISIVSGHKVKTGTKIKFNVVYDDSKFKVVKWTGLSDGIDQTSATQTVTVKSDITVSVELGTLPVPEGKVRILFDSNKIGCSNGTTHQFVNPGDAVAENTQLTFSASGVEIDHWFVNNMEKSSDKTFSYTVTAADATDRTITVTYKEKEYPVLTFDSAKMEVETFEVKPKTLSSGYKVSYLQPLRFKAKLSPGRSIEKWMINDTDKTDKFRLLENNDYSYTVALDDVKDGVLRVTFTEKPTVRKKITFDSTTIAVFKTGSEPPTQIASGTEISEGDTLAFSATLPFGTIVEEWKINDKNIAGSKQYVGYYPVKTEDLSSTDMTVSITTKNPSIQGTLKLGAKVTCKKVKTPLPETTEELHDGTQIQETDILYVQSSETGTGIWKINGELERPLGKSPKVQIQWPVEAKHFKNGEIKIEFIK